MPPADRPTLVGAWGEAHAVGRASTGVHLASDPERTASVEIFDLRETHGIFLGILVTTADATAIVDASNAAPLPPRVAHVRKDAVAAFTEVDANATSILGWDTDEVVGRSTLDFIHPDDQDTGIESWIEMIADPTGTQSTRLRHLHKEGSWVWLEITNVNRLADPDHEDVLTELVDISAEVSAHEALRAREHLLVRGMRGPGSTSRTPSTAPDDLSSGLCAARREPVPPLVVSPPRPNGGGCGASATVARPCECRRARRRRARRSERLGCGGPGDRVHVIDPWSGQCGGPGGDLLRDHHG